jgi:hypothetical protein
LASFAEELTDQALGLSHRRLLSPATAFFMRIGLTANLPLTLWNAGHGGLRTRLREETDLLTLEVDIAFAFEPNRILALQELSERSYWTRVWVV